MLGRFTTDFPDPVGNATKTSRLFKRHSAAAGQDTLNQFREPWLLFQRHRPVQFHISLTTLMQSITSCHVIVEHTIVRIHACYYGTLDVHWPQLADWLIQITSECGLIVC